MSDETKAVLLVALCFTCFSISDACAKFLGETIPPLEVVAVTSAAIAFTSGSICLAGSIRNGLRSPHVYSHALRSVAMSVSAVINFSALPHVSLPQFYTVMFSSPFFVLLLSWAIFRQRFPMILIFAILLGFVGVSIGLEPWRGDLNPWILVLLASPCFFAFGSVVTRYIDSGERVLLLAFYPKFLAAVVFSPYLLSFIDRGCSLWQAGLLLIMASCDLCGYLSLGRGYQLGNAGMLAPVHYLQLVWGILLGFFIWETWPSAGECYGSLLVVVCGLIILRSKRRVQPADICNEIHDTRDVNRYSSNT